jgi:hypothetical protein
MNIFLFLYHLSIDKSGKYLPFLHIDNLSIKDEDFLVFLMI